MTDAAFEVRGVSKTFGATRALRDVSFEVGAGAIRGLVGSNGSGKSTLIKILAGIYPANAGEVRIRGAAFDAGAMTASTSKAAGIRVVHQQDSVFPDLTVAENLAIGRGFETGPVWKIRWRSQRRWAKDVLSRFRIPANPNQLVATTRPAVRTMIVIARALQDQEESHGGMLVLDEPTRSLPPAEVDVLLAALRRYAAAGQTIIFVSHRLEEILSVTDAVTVLRDGRLVGSKPTQALSHETLAELIVGRAVEELGHSPQASKSMRPRKTPVLQVTGLCGGAVRDVSLTVAAGEIVGVTGLLGSGRSTLLRLLFGLQELEKGEVLVDGEALRPRNPAEAMAAGIAYIPEDRAGQASFEQLTVSENLAISATDVYWRRAWFRSGDERADSRRLIQEHGIRCAGEAAPLKSLSGGNQQKVILARWMRRQPVLLLLDEPTQGVDIGARTQIYKLFRAEAQRGAGLLLVSSDAEELQAISDRVVRLREGRIAANLAHENLSDIRIEQLESGAT